MNKEFALLKHQYLQILLQIVKQQSKKDIFDRSCLDSDGVYFLEKTTSTTKIASLKIGRCQYIVLSGPNGVGKDTIGQKLANFGFPRLPNVTTRKRRPWEKEGIDYYFWTEKQFHTAKEKGEFLTYKKRHGTDWHGFLKKPFIKKLQKGEKFHLDKSPASWQTLLQIPKVRKSSYIACYVLPPSYEEWIKRLTKRTAQTDKEKVATRIKDSLKKIGRAHV